MPANGDLRQVFDDLVRFETDLWNQLDARLREECGVDLGTVNVLLVLDRTRSCRVQDVATALSITVGGASQAVDRLERRGYCARTANSADRRSSIVEATGAGRAALRRAAPVFDRELDARLAGPLSAAALSQLADTLGALRTAQTP
jgi:DNA-binding MarR family transcriptional regulator